jgi:membrane carboxypeptidase/penicillin-binding protein PbpC
MKKTHNHDAFKLPSTLQLSLSGQNASSKWYINSRGITKQCNTEKEIWH